MRFPTCAGRLDPIDARYRGIAQQDYTRSEAEKQYCQQTNRNFAGLLWT